MTTCVNCLNELSPIEKAKAELEQENFDAEVSRQKQKLLNKKSFSDYLPFKIKITWR